MNDFVKSLLLLTLSPVSQYMLLLKVMMRLIRSKVLLTVALIRHQLNYRNTLLSGKGIQVYYYDLHCYCFVLISYHPIWETQKEAFFRRYRTLDPSVSQFDADIQRSVHVSLCVHVSVSLSHCVCVHVYMCACAWMYPCVHMSICVCVSLCVCVCIHLL